MKTKTALTLTSTAIVSAISALAALSAGPIGSISLLSPASAMAAPTSPSDAGARCAALKGITIKDSTIVSSEPVAASGDLPGFCQVKGFAAPAINFDLKLPLSGWNSKLYMAGCGGFCGLIDPKNGNDGLKRSYAVISTDTGHVGKSLLDTSFAVSNQPAIIDFAYRGISEAARVGKAITTAFYRSAIRHSYFNGCSNGGRQALMEATRYPDDFDGIIAGAPGFDIEGGMSLLVNGVQADTGPDAKPIFNPAKVKLVADAVARTCGDETGLVTSPLTCRFKPEDLQCRAGDGPSCLTGAEVAVLNKWYSPPRLKDGRTLFVSGIVHGSEPFWYHPSPYSNAVLGDAKMIATQAFNNLSPDLPRDLTIAQYDPETQSSKLGAAMRMATPAPDLRGLHARKGKLLIYHGWADPTLPPARTIDFYRDLERSIGGKQDTARLFLIPGMSHCGNPAGVEVPGFDRNGFDPLTALEQWVEHGKTPEALLGTKFDSRGGVRFTRPICAYPKAAQYNGSGNRNDASNWVCRDEVQQ